MSVRVHRSERSRHLVIRAPAGELLPDCLLAVLRDERVSCGWLRASGVVTEVHLRTFDDRYGRSAEARRIASPVQLLLLESSIGLADGQPDVSLRAVLARESGHALETFAGEIVSARSLGIEALVTVFDDLSLNRTVDNTTGVALLDSASAPGAVRLPTAPTVATWSAAAEASAQANRDPRGAFFSPPSPATSATAARSSAASFATSPMTFVPMPQRPAKPEVDLNAPVPEPGDLVDHFAFGRCEVLKSDGDRLHLRVDKGGRIREIALEMLRVTRLEGDGTRRHYKLERRI